jgi:hypothetical protein
MLAANIENLLFLLLIAVAVLFQLLAKAAGKTGKDQTKRTLTPQAPPPIPRAPAESDEERIRKLLEALGQPPASKPPQTVAPRTNIPARPVAPVQPPFSPLRQLRREKPRKREVIAKQFPPPPIVAHAKETIPPKITVAPGFEVHEGPLPVEPPPTIKTSVEAYAAAARPITQKEELKTEVATLLASKSGLREAIILREILGPPRGLRALDLL